MIGWLGCGIPVVGAVAGIDWLAVWIRRRRLRADCLANEMARVAVRLRALTGQAWVRRWRVGRRIGRCDCQSDVGFLSWDGFIKGALLGVPEYGADGDKVGDWR